MATAAALLFGASTSPPAFAVIRNPDGTVTVNLMHRSGIPILSRLVAGRADGLLACLQPACRRHVRPARPGASPRFGLRASG